ncbi:MAG: hypothetical protein AAB444_01955 [Patescibacteria group bacterium]
MTAAIAMRLRKKPGFGGKALAFGRVIRPAIEKYQWTSHARYKMQYYRISESRVKRIIRFPKRTEEGIAPKTVASMQLADGKTYAEIWVMYRLADGEGSRRKALKIITAWRYPGISPERDPVPQEILDEVRGII